MMKCSNSTKHYRSFRITFLTCCAINTKDSKQEARISQSHVLTGGAENEELPWTQKDHRSPPKNVGPPGLKPLEAGSVLQRYAISSSSSTLR